MESVENAITTKSFSACLVADTLPMAKLCDCLLLCMHAGLPARRVGQVCHKRGLQYLFTIVGHLLGWFCSIWRLEGRQLLSVCNRHKLSCSYCSVKHVSWVSADHHSWVDAALPCCSRGRLEAGDAEVQPGAQLSSVTMPKWLPAWWQHGALAWTKSNAMHQAG